jgi:hypothetical protein
LRQRSPCTNAESTSGGGVPGVAAASSPLAAAGALLRAGRRHGQGTGERGGEQQEVRAGHDDLRTG